MWQHAADTAVQGSDGLLAAVITMAGLVVTGLVTVVVALINRGKSTPPPPIPPPHQEHPSDDPEVSVRERLRVVEFRADMGDHSNEIQDRRLDQIERHLDIRNPRWRAPE